MNNKKLFALIKKILKKYRLRLGPTDFEALFKFLVAGLVFVGGMRIYGNVLVDEIISDIIRSLQNLILDRSKSVKGEDVKKQYFILLPLFLKLIEDDKKDENEEDEEIETSLEKKKS